MILKAERHSTEVAIYQMRGEGGLQAMRTWLYDQQASVNARWADYTGDDLIKAQGEAKLLAKLIKMIDTGPAIRPIGGTK